MKKQHTEKEAKQYNKLLEHLAATMVKARVGKKLSPSDLAYQIGVTPQCINQHEKGRLTNAYRVIFDYANATGCELILELRDKSKK